MDYVDGQLADICHWWETDDASVGEQLDLKRAVVMLTREIELIKEVHKYELQKLSEHYDAELAQLRDELEAVRGEVSSQ